MISPDQANFPQDCGGDLTWATPRDVVFRRDPWGGLASRSRGQIFKLTHQEIIALDLCRIRPLGRDILDGRGKAIGPTLTRLNGLGLIDCSADQEQQRHTPQSFETSLLDLTTLEEKSKKYPLARPLWAHIQPFTACNENCIHCYCNGGPKGSKFSLSLSQWIGIIDQIAATGVFEIYLTGGETFLYEESLVLADHILNLGLCTGFSTNATVLKKGTLDWIESRGIQTIQVSLDGANRGTHDHIRRTPGSFDRTIEGIKKLRDITGVSVNCVVNKYNISEIHSVIRLCSDLQVKTVRFFPQKAAGRAVASDCISEEQWAEISFMEYQNKYSINIEYTALGHQCSSGNSGFSVDQFGDIYPCIFGVENQALKLGNALHDDLDQIWFAHPVLDEFRNKCRKTICRRCEI